MLGGGFPILAIRHECREHAHQEHRHERHPPRDLSPPSNRAIPGEDGPVAPLEKPTTDSPAGPSHERFHLLLGHGGEVIDRQAATLTEPLAVIPGHLLPRFGARRGHGDLHVL